MGITCAAYFPLRSFFALAMLTKTRESAVCEEWEVPLYKDIILSAQRKKIEGGTSIDTHTKKTAPRRRNTGAEI